ncbi:Rpp20 subunit of nuclear RNase MRP and P-domain-containing protein, partial [Staphylotrichum tortipilum]
SPSTDPDGYPLPPRAPHTSVLKVTASASFMSLVTRARKALEKSAPSSSSRHTHGAGKSQPPLAARIAAVRDSTAAAAAGTGERGVVCDAQDDVVLVATGRAIQKAVEVGGFFTRERDLVVAVRTRTVKAVDDVVAVDEEEAEGEDAVRVRGVSCVEVGIRWAS